MPASGLYGPILDSSAHRGGNLRSKSPLSRTRAAIPSEPSFTVVPLPIQALDDNYHRNRSHLPGGRVYHPQRHDSSGFDHSYSEFSDDTFSQDLPTSGGDTLKDDGTTLICLSSREKACTCRPGMEHKVDPEVSRNKRWTMTQCICSANKLVCHSVAWTMITVIECLDAIVSNICDLFKYSLGGIIWACLCPKSERDVFRQLEFFSTETSLVGRFVGKLWVPFLARERVLPSADVLCGEKPKKEVHFDGLVTLPSTTTDSYRQSTVTLEAEGAPMCSVRVESQEYLLPNKEGVVFESDNFVVTTLHEGQAGCGVKDAGRDTRQWDEVAQCAVTATESELSNGCNLFCF